MKSSLKGRKYKKTKWSWPSGKMVLAGASALVKWQENPNFYGPFGD